MASSWIDPLTRCMRFISLQDLSDLTSETEEDIELIASAAGGETTVETPFAGGPPTEAAWTITVDGVALAFSAFEVDQRIGADGTDEVTLDAALTAGARVTGSCIGSVNVTNLLEAILQGQGDVRGVLAAAGWACPADTASAPGKLIRWAWDIAAWNLFTNARRPGLIGSKESLYEGVVRRYEALTEGPTSIFSLIRRGEYDLSDILSRIPPATDGGPDGDTSGESRSGLAWISNVKVFSDRSGAI